MNYRLLGNTGLEVSEIGFGAWGIGGTERGAVAYGPTDDEVSRKTLRKAFDTGITFYDTADLYGYGHSEELIGETLKDVRHKIVIASKVGFINFEGQQDFSPTHLRKALERSLKRLQTDYIDLYQLHTPSMELLQQDDRIVSTMHSFVKEGKVRVVGVALRSPEDSEVAIKKNGFKSIQLNFNLVDQRYLTNGIFEVCQKNNVGIIVRTPLCFGFLTGQYSSRDNYDSHDYRSKWSLEQVERWASAYKLFASSLMEIKQQSNAQIALRFCLSYPSVSTVIPGMLTQEHVNENAASSQMGPLSQKELKTIHKIYQEHNFFVRS